MIIVIDYNVGNVKSVCNAFKHIGCEAKLSCAPVDIEDAWGIVLPGVAAFGYAVSALGSLAELIREVALKGKPLLGIRTANHALAVRRKIAKGHAKWDTFCRDVLGCGNHGYGPEALGSEVRVVRENADHPILAGVQPTQWHSNGSLYLVKPIDKAATVLLMGSVGDKSEPVAWTRRCGKSRVFYTSLGYPDDFKLPQFSGLLINGVFWAMDRPVPENTAEVTD